MQDIDAGMGRARDADVKLRQFNLNLLTALDALLEERSVTRAAARLGVTQPAMSHSLAQLRTVLGDPLLVRGQRGLHPTPRAEGLMRPLRAHLRGLEATLRTPQGFAAATSTRRFRVAAPDLLAGLITPVLMRFCGDEAPGVALDIEILTPDWNPARLETGEVDLALSSAVRQSPGQMREVIYRDEYACLARVGHPGIGSDLDLKSFTAFPHVVVASTPDMNRQIDAALARARRPRRVALEIPYLLLAPLVVAYTNLLFVGPRLVCELTAMGIPLQVLKPPLRLPTLTEDLVWHERAAMDPAHLWLRDTIHRTVDAVRAVRHSSRCAHRATPRRRAGAGRIAEPPRAHSQAQARGDFTDWLPIV